MDILNYAIQTVLHLLKDGIQKAEILPLIFLTIVIYILINNDNNKPIH